MAFLTSCSGDASAKSGNSPAATTEKSVVNVDAPEFKKLIADNAGVLIDVRTPQEHQAGAIPGTKMNIDVTNRSFKTEMSKLDKDKPYLIYCRSGARSGRAAQIMESMGFKHIYNLKRGYMGWKRAGM